MTLDPEAPGSSAALLLTGTVWADLPSMRWLGSLMPQTLILRGYPVPSEELAIDLPDHQLIAIEDARGEGDLRLTVKLQGALLRPGPDVHPVAAWEGPVVIQRAR